MALQIHVQINGRPTHVIEARRVSHLDVIDPDPNTVMTYDVEVHHHAAGGTHPAGETSVEHRWGDGELTLAARALDAVAMAPAPRVAALEAVR